MHQDRLRILASTDGGALTAIAREAYRTGIMPRMMGSFEGESIEEMLTTFEAPLDSLAGGHLLLAVYDEDDYEGSAHVVYEKDGQLWEVNASHCSCYGLEGQWQPDETGVVELRFRLDRGGLGSHADVLRSLLDWLFGPALPQTEDDPPPATPPTTEQATMYCTPILIADPCNDPTVNPAEFLAVALRAVEQPPCASHVWTVRVQTAAPDCATTESEGVAHAKALAATAAQLMTHLEAPWYEAIAAREALDARAELGTPPALTPPAEDTSAAPPPTQGPT